jgi:hypothetical protein
MVWNNSAGAFGELEVGATLTIKNGAITNNFTGSGNCGFQTSGISYVINP